MRDRVRVPSNENMGNPYALYRQISGGSRISTRSGRQLSGGGGPTHDFANFPKNA